MFYRKKKWYEFWIKTDKVRYYPFSKETEIKILEVREMGGKLQKLLKKMEIIDRGKCERE